MDALVRQHGDPARNSIAERLRRLVPLLATALLLLPMGCQRAQIYSATQLPSQYVARRVPDAQSLSLTNLAQTAAESQRIFPGDVLNIAVATGIETEEQAAWPPIRVGERGSVDLPLVGQVQVAGLDLDAAEQRIREESIRRGIYRAPNVSVTIAAHRTNSVTVIGAVQEPGIKELPSSASDIFSALVAAGGLSEDAGTVVEIRHPNHPNNAQLASFPGTPPNPAATPVERLDLAQLNRTPHEISLDDGAVVTVMKQPARTVQVLGLVNNPAEIDMPAGRDMRLLDAVAQAGGLTLQVANKVRVIRQVPGKPEPVMIETTLRSAKSSGEANVLLAAGDVVSVEETPLTFTVEMLRSFIRFGFTSAIPGF